MTTPPDAIVHHIAPGFTATVTSDHTLQAVQVADLQALRSVAAELRALLDALGTPEATPQVLRSAQGLARSVAQRREAL